MSNQSVSSWFKNGTPWVWLNAGAVSISLVMVIGLLGLIAVRGLSHFWPADIVVVDYTEPGRAPIQLLGEVVDKETVSALRLKSAGVELPEGQSSAQRFLLKIGNRDYFGLDFRWVVGPWMSEGTYPENVVAVERREWGHFYGYLSAVKESGQLVASNDVAWDELQSRLERANGLVAQIKDIEKHDIGEINHGLESLRLEARQLEIEGVNEGSLQHQEIAQSRQGWNDQYKVLQKELEALYIALNRDQMMMTMSDGREVEIPLSKVVDAYRPNAMSTLDKLAFYFHEVWKFVSGDPREAIPKGVFSPLFSVQ